MKPLLSLRGHPDGGSLIIPELPPEPPFNSPHDAQSSFSAWGAHFTCFTMFYYVVVFVLQCFPLTSCPVSCDLRSKEPHPCRPLVGLLMDMYHAYVYSFLLPLCPSLLSVQSGLLGAVESLARMQFWGKGTLSIFICIILGGVPCIGSDDKDALRRSVGPRDPQASAWAPISRSCQPWARFFSGPGLFLWAQAWAKNCKPHLPEARFRRLTRKKRPRGL